MEQIDEKTQLKINELQRIEEEIHNLTLQKDLITQELTEKKNLLDELKKTSSQDSFVLVNNVLIKKNNDELKKEIESKIEILELRLKSFDKQEKSLIDKKKKLQKEIVEGINKK